MVLLQHTFVLIGVIIIGGRVVLPIQGCSKPTVAATEGFGTGRGITTTLQAAIRLILSTAKVDYIFL